MSHNFKTYYDCYRHCRHERGLTRSLALRQSQTEWPELYRKYFEAQNRGEKWTLERLDLDPEKDARRLAIIERGGKLT